jgi:acyl-coenzyme A thioesterase PaaI-like protein
MSDGDEAVAAELHADARGHFVSTMGFEFGDQHDRHFEGSLLIDPYLQAEGLPWPNVASLLTMADVLIGRLASHHTAPRISVTSDLGIRLFDPPVGERVQFRAILLKVGRTMSVGEARLFSEYSGAMVGTALGTFLASPRPADVVPFGFSMERRDEAPRARTLAEQVGVTRTRPGVAEMPALRTDLTNATQSLQGGIVALLGEEATYSAVKAGGGDQVIDTLEVHYVSAGRIGPFRASAETLGRDPSRGYFRVEVRDLGLDRLIAVIETTTRALAR